MFHIFGDGAVGIGTMERSGEEKTKSEQTLYRLGGSTFSLEHNSKEPGTQNTAQSLNISPAGVWQERED